MLIDFVHTGDAYLPELQAYMIFLQNAGHEARIHRQIDSIPTSASVLWWMCGRVGTTLAHRYPSAFHIHEYASASIPPLAWFKDHLKRWSQATPNYRIFQNDWVHQRMSFQDETPWEFRDMGVASAFFESPTSNLPPEYDFVYLGEMRRLQHFLPLFEALHHAGRSVLLIGQLPDELRPYLLRYNKLHLTGKVPHDDVPALLRRACYGLNLVPDHLPFSRQTSTKLLEYCAAGLRVVSTDYTWVREFERTYGARFAYIPDRASATDYQPLITRALDTMPLRVPDVRRLAWPNLLSELNIWHLLGIQT